MLSDSGSDKNSEMKESSTGIYMLYGSQISSQGSKTVSS